MDQNNNKSVFQKAIEFSKTLFPAKTVENNDMAKSDLEKQAETFANDMIKLERRQMSYSQMRSIYG